MTSASEQIQDLVTLTSHSNESHKSFLQSIYKVRFNKILKKIKDMIKADYDPEKTTKTAQRALTKKVTSTLKTELDSLKRELYSDVESFVKDSSKLYGDQLTAVFEPVDDFININFPEDEDVIKGFNNNLLNFEKGSHTVDSIWTTFYASLLVKINSAIQQAYDLEQSESDFTSNLFGVSGSTNTSVNNLSSVIGALVAHGYNTALKYGNMVNEAVIRGYIYLAVMDSHTSEICSYLNGRTYYYGHPELGTLPYEVYPGLHYNCRSTTSPITKSYTELGINPDDLTADQKILLSGETPQVETYSEFFEKQPKSIQRDILGPTRYSMYKENNLTVDKFYTRDGRKYSLNELLKKGYSVSGDYLRYIRKG